MRFERDDSGFAIKLPIEERELLASLPGQLLELLDEDNQEDPAIARLFPDAYTAADADLAEEFRRLMSDDLRERHRAALETLAGGAHAEHISGDELYSWMTALNQLRLVIGTRLEVTEDWEPDDDEPAGDLYDYLTFLQGQIIEALSTA